MSSDVLRSGLNLMRRLPPSKVRQNLAALTRLVGDNDAAVEQFLQRVDTPLLVAKDASAPDAHGRPRPFLLCDYNRDGDCFRSPHSNSYVNPSGGPLDAGIEEAFKPTAGLRELEVAANEVFDAYREAYYESTSQSVSSVYFWEIDAGFASCWLVKKEIGAGRYVKSGSWDAIHVVEAALKKDAAGKPVCTYKLTTTVLLSMQVGAAAASAASGAASAAGVGAVDLSGSLTRQATASMPAPSVAAHVANMGGMIEAMEGDLRASMDALYIAKTREIVAALHAQGASARAASGVTRGAFVSDLASAVAKHAK